MTFAEHWAGTLPELAAVLQRDYRETGDVAAACTLLLDHRMIERVRSTTTPGRFSLLITKRGLRHAAEVLSGDEL